ncbi:energy transducer TonB [Novilysobacter selenitireducens]|uniref:Protein TonB n=1 Tax=Novilysobacter selenitireducens TaxID=2872639 RepID=A0ABS7T2B3_9GAMM|nr:energy transducer TonB [Lysobacter selenitireducens]MBZ4038009.1 energy transducer TonB [Lysobacter selenitireducens]
MTVVDQSGRPSRRPYTILNLSLMLALGLGLAACGKDDATPDAADPAARGPAATEQATPETAVSSRVSAMSEDELREAARSAYAENRLYAPAEDNAVEYYLALREKSPGDAGVSSALTDLLPMTVIAIEQSVGREDFNEARRLAALLERADDKHPALARLKTSIGEREQAAEAQAERDAVTAEEQAERQAELERERAAQQQAQQEQAARDLAARQAAEREAAAEQAAADERAAEQAAAEQRAAEQRAAQQRAAQQAAASTATAADLRPISTPAPRFPPEALRAGQSGEVQVEFTVGTDGSVTNARVVRSNPARVFDREAVSAVRSWRFQPLPNAVTTRRTIGFNPGG